MYKQYCTSHNDVHLQVLAPNAKRYAKASLIYVTIGIRDTKAKLSCMGYAKTKFPGTVSQSVFAPFLAVADLISV